MRQRRLRYSSVLGKSVTLLAVGVFDALTSHQHRLVAGALDGLVDGIRIGGFSDGVVGAVVPARSIALGLDRPRNFARRRRGRRMASGAEVF